MPRQDCDSFFHSTKKPAYEDQNLFQQDLDDKLSKWQDNQTSIRHLQIKSFELTQRIKAPYGVYS